MAIGLLVEFATMFGTVVCSHLMMNKVIDGVMNKLLQLVRFSG